METATVLVVAAALGHRAGSVLAVAGNRVSGAHLDNPESRQQRDQAVEDAIDTAIEAVRRLAGSAS
jgi:uridine phosphorylase